MAFEIETFVRCSSVRRKMPAQNNLYNSLYETFASRKEITC